MGGGDSRAQEADSQVAGDLFHRRGRRQGLRPGSARPLWPTSAAQPPNILYPCSRASRRRHRRYLLLHHHSPTDTPSSLRLPLPHRIVATQQHLSFPNHQHDRQHDHGPGPGGGTAKGGGRSSSGWRQPSRLQQSHKLGRDQNFVRVGQLELAPVMAAGDDYSELEFGAATVVAIVGLRRLRCRCFLSMG